MKRNYSKTYAAAALSGLLLATGLFASADTGVWHAVRNGAAIEGHGGPAKVSPLTKYRRSMGYVNPASPVQPSFDGVRPTPRISQRPANIMRSPEAPRGNVYGVINRYNDMEYANQAFVAKIDLATGAFQKLYDGRQFCPYTGEDYLLQTGAYANGKIYVPSTGGEYGVSWSVSDFETGDLIETINFTGVAGVPYSLTYDPDKDLFYALCIDDTSGRDCLFMTIDPNRNWSVDEVISLRDEYNMFFAAIAYNPSDKQIYVFSEGNHIYRVFANGDNPVMAGEIDTELMLFNQAESAAVCYSPADEAFIIIHPDNTLQQNDIFYLDLNTLELVDGQVAGKEWLPYIANVFCTDDFAVADAPEIPGVPTFSFDKARLSGSVSFKAPEFTYVGVALAGQSFRTVATVDGENVYDQNVTAGQEITIPLTLAEGQHTLKVVSYIGDNASPARTVNFYTGNDAPAAPANVTLRGTTLSWDAPTAGAHQGYVDFDVMTYDVYMNGVKQNAAPITATSYELDNSGDFNMCKFEVKAIANGKESEAGSHSEVFGHALTLPFANEPTREEAALYRTINHNNDERVFFYADERDDAASNGYYGWAMVVGYTTNADDWLIFPLINFPSKDYLYNFQFDMLGAYLDMATIESYEIYLGKEPTVESMFEGTNIYSDNFFRPELGGAKTHQSLNFAVKEAGDYYLAIRVNSNKDVDPSGQGLIFSDFKISVAEGKSTVVPGDPTSVVFHPDETGNTEFDVDVTIPTLDITGSPLPADMDITIDVSYNGYTNSKTGKPGETVTIGHDAGTNGYANVLITPRNENGSGYPRSHRSYFGIDTPLCPTDIKGQASADNRSFDVTWTAPGAIGENGGFVPVDEMTYNFYTRQGVAFTQVGSNITDTKYTFSPFPSDKNIAATQDTYYVGPSALTEAGESKNSLFVMADLGDPYELPVLEEWGTQTFDFSPYHFMTTGAYDGSNWENVGSMDGMRIGDPVFVQGGIIGFSTAGALDAQIIFPKATTKGIAKTRAKVRVWDYAEAPKSIIITASRYGHEDQIVLHEAPLTNPAKGEWVDVDFALPDDFNNCDWLQMRVGCHLTGPEYIVLDSYEIYPDIDYDLKVASVSGPTQVSIGDEPVYKVTVANSGRERISGVLKVEILNAEGEVFATNETPIEALTASQLFEYNAKFELTGSMRELSDLVVKATVMADNDENTGNDTRSINAQMMGSQLPVVNDLAAKQGDNYDVTLTWSTPTGQYGNFENFETANAFEVTDQINRFQNYDLDKQIPLTLNNGAINLEWEGCYKPQGWTVVNMEDLNLMNDTRIYPHSGKQVLMARSAYYDEGGTPPQSAKFLVSPKVQAGSTVSWWWSTLDSGTVEYIEVWEASKEDAVLGEFKEGMTVCGNFTKTASFNKTGSDTWELTSVKLRTNTKYFAIRYSAYDGLAVVLDDLQFVPADMLDHEVSSYNVYRSDNGEDPVLVAENVTATSYVDNSWQDTKAWYHVVANTERNGRMQEGPKSNLVYVNGSSVSNIDVASAIRGGVGEIIISNLAGENFAIATADGKIVNKGNVSSAQAHYGLDKGIYVVTVGKTSVKVVVK